MSKVERFLHVDEIANLLKAKKKHDVGEINDILPFLSKRTHAIKQYFNNVIGEYVRVICNLEIDHERKKDEDELFTISDHPLVEQIIEKVEAADDHKIDLKLFLENHLFSEDEIKPTHPHLYNYVSFPNEHERELKNYAQFIFDTLIINENENLISIFSNKDADDILTELILNKLDGLKPKSYGKKYQPLLINMAQLYQKDILYLSNYKDYFLRNFPLLTHFYAFMYCCQLLLKFEQFHLADYDKLLPLYFALEWESLSGRRSAAGIEGFKRIKEKSKNLFVHIHTISQLSHNRMNKEKRFMNYSELYNLVKEDNDTYHTFLQDIKDWIGIYREWSGIKKISEPESLEEAFKTLFESLQEGMNARTCERYGQNIDDLGSSLFLKNRGSLGQVLNMNQDMLLLLTAVCIKNERIPLNHLFIEFEKRGVAFDRYSKKEIIHLFDSLNIIDKKSDSGDAQYVKPIL